MYTAQSLRPAALIVSLTRKTLSQLSHTKTPLPFRPNDIILSFPAFWTEESFSLYGEFIPDLIKKGYKRFIINNMGQFSFFKNQQAKNDAALLIAGPSLYTFNRFSAAFFSAQNAALFITPLENNRQNLERTFDTNERNSVFITVFAYPPLFTIGSDLTKIYAPFEFSDNRDEHFRISHNGDRESSFVVPVKPFSITGKIPFLKKSGFKRFIVDFSGANVHKNDYKKIMGAALNALPINDSTYFNWKDGFFSAEPVEKPSKNADSFDK
jgi:putative protease